MTVHDLSEGLEPIEAWFNEHEDSARLVAINSAT